MVVKNDQNVVNEAAEKKDEDVSTTTGNEEGSGWGTRHVQAALLFCGMLLAFAMRANMSLAIVAMTDINATQHFDWGQEEKGPILSSFFWGYVILQIPAGVLAVRLGGRALCAAALGINALVLLILPSAAIWGGWKAVCACRALQGLAQGCLYPGTHHLIARWVPPREKARLATFIYSGGQIGIALQLLSAGWVGAIWGWPAIFYSVAALSAVWTALYLTFGADSPQSCRYIKSAELEYIQRSLGHNQQTEETHKPVPWLPIIKSVPFWGVIIAHCGQNYGYFTLMTEISTYMDKVLRVKLTNNGLLSSLQYVAMCVCSAPIGILSDRLVRTGKLSTTHARKLFNTIGLWGPALAMTGLAWASDAKVAVALLVMAGICNSAQFSGYMLVHIDLAPSFSGALMGVTNFTANLVSIVAPLIAGAIIGDTEHENDVSRWRLVLLVCAGILLVTNAIFLLLVSAKRQPWDPPDSDNMKIDKTKRQKEHPNNINENTTGV